MTNDATEACISFAALFIGALMALPLKTNGLPIGAVIMALLLYFSVWTMGVHSERRHCKVGEKANISRAAIKSLIPGIIMLVLFLLAAFALKICVFGEVPSCGPELEPVKFFVKMAHIPEKAAVFAIIFPWGFLLAWLFSFIAISSMNHEPCENA